MQISITELRSNIYQYFEQIKETNTPLEIAGKKGHFIIDFVKPISRLKLLEETGLDLYDGDSDELFEIKWPDPSQEDDKFK